MAWLAARAWLGLLGLGLVPFGLLLRLAVLVVVIVDLSWLLLLLAWVSCRYVDLIVGALVLTALVCLIGADCFDCWLVGLIWLMLG